MIYLYSFIYALLLCLYFPFFFLKFKRKKESLDLILRLALNLPPRQDKQPCLWFHAVSVGEVLSLQNLLDELSRLHPEWRLLVTSLTPSGIRLARERFQGKAEIWPVPIDFPWCLSRFFKKVKPSLLALVESEFWPNLIRQARRNSVPVILINGRISPRTFKRIKKFRFLFLPLLRQIDLFLVQSIREKEKFEEIGIDETKIKVTGNLKTEVNLPLYPEADKNDFRKKLGITSDEKVITAGSTHPGEEKILLLALKKIREKKPQYKLIIAPRHPARWPEIADQCSFLSLDWQRWSLLKERIQGTNQADLNWEVLIVDTLGELPFFYFLADLAFVGGSLVPRGGHNLLEPAFYGKPIVYGPYMDNFAYLADYFLERGAATRVFQESDLVALWEQIGEASLAKMGAQAKKALKELEGATGKTIAFLEEVVKRNPNNNLKIAIEKND